MDKLEIMQYLIADTIQQQSDLPKIDECIKKVHIKQTDYRAKTGNYLSYDDAWKDIWGVKPLPTRAKIKDNLKMIRRVALEISKEV